jgi:Phage tail assembly chaperone protein, TAC
MPPPGRSEFQLENGNKFYIRRYDAFLSLRILGEVQKKFLSPLASFMEAQDKSLGEEVQMRNMFDALEKISRSLDGESLVDLTKKVLNPEYISVSYQGEPAEQLNEGMLNRVTDSVYDVILLVIEVLKVNYSELFTRGRTLIGTAQGATAIH